MAIWHTVKRQAIAAIATGLLSASALAQTVSITATPDPAVQGTPVTLQVRVASIVDLFAYQFSLLFNPSILQATSVTTGGFLATGGTTSFGAGTINNGTGRVNFVFDSLIGSVPGVSGAGALANITFNAVGLGSSTLSFADAVFLNSSLGDITVTLQGRSLNVVPIPEPTTYALMGLGLMAVAGAARRRLRA